MLIFVRTYKLPFLFICLIASSFKVAGQQRKGKKLKSIQEPKFIENIYLDGHMRTKATTYAIDTLSNITKKAPHKVEGKDALAGQMMIPTTNDTAFSTDYKTTTAIDLSSSNLLSEKYAQMIGVQIGDQLNPNLYQFVDKWYGTNYRLGGFSEQGIDCSGFTKLLYQEVYSKELPRTSVEQHKNAVRERTHGNAKEGDLVFFRQRGKRINHVGVYLGNAYFIHASSSHGVMISNLNEAHWQKSFAGIGKLSDKSGQ